MADRLDRSDRKPNAARVPRTGPAASAPRERLIAQALAAFEENGFRSVNVTQIISRAGVARMTLYHHFGSKDELIVAALRRKDEEQRARLLSAARSRPAGDPAALLEVVEHIAASVRSGRRCGCVIARAAAEFNSDDSSADAIRRLCVEHQRLLIDDLSHLAERAGLAHPRPLATQLFLVIEGLLAHAHAVGEAPDAPQLRSAAADAAVAAARALIGAAGGA